MSQTQGVCVRCGARAGVKERVLGERTLTLAPPHSGIANACPWRPALRCCCPAAACPPSPAHMPRALPLGRPPLVGRPTSRPAPPPGRPAPPPGRARSAAAASGAFFCVFCVWRARGHALGGGGAPRAARVWLACCVPAHDSACELRCRGPPVRAMRETEDRVPRPRQPRPPSHAPSLPLPSPCLQAAPALPPPPTTRPAPPMARTRRPPPPPPARPRPRPP